MQLESRKRTGGGFGGRSVEPDAVLVGFHEVLANTEICRGTEKKKSNN
jgi:hypothetical protein